MPRLWTFVVASVLALTACDDQPAARERDEAGASASDTPDARETTDARAATADESPANDARDAGSAPTMIDASAAADAGRVDASFAGDATLVIDAGRPLANAPALRISSDTSSIEFTPALYTAKNLYPGSATVSSGGIANLFGAGGADLGTNAETQALRQSADHPNLRILCTVTETFYRVVARRSAGITQLSDLRGKRVGTVTNTSAHYYLDKMLRTVGSSAADVSVVSVVPLSRMAAMLMGGQVDAVASWEPEPQNAMDALGSDAIEFQDRAVYREIVNLHTTSERLADPEKRRGMVAFVKALIAAADAFQNRPDEVLPLVSDAIGYPEPLLKKVWHLERFPGRLVADLLDVLEQEEPWVARQTNRTARSREELAKLIDDSVLRDALAAP
jgi:sulfonate transport system substrate-binding protein